jgi:hypothetical protein
MAGPRKSTIEKKIKSILEVLKNTRYQDAIKLKKVTEKAESLVESLSGSAASKTTKRKPTAYQLFVKAETAKLKKANPTMKQTDLISEAAKKWQESKPPGSAPAVKKPKAEKKPKAVAAPKKPATKKSA